jgi:hypothetical protein
MLTAVFIGAATGFLSHMSTVHSLNLTVSGYLDKVVDASGKDENN